MVKRVISPPADRTAKRLSAAELYAKHGAAAKPPSATMQRPPADRVAVRR